MHRLQVAAIPLRPLRDLTVVRVQVVHEVNQGTHEVATVVADGIRDSSEEVEEDVGGVERAEDRDVGCLQSPQQLADEGVSDNRERDAELGVVVPFGRAVRGEQRATLGLEAVVTHQSGQTLVLWQTVGREVVDGGRVEFHKAIELLLADLGPPVGLEVVLDQLGGGDVDLVKQAEERSLVLHVTVQDRHVGDFACGYELVGTLGQELAVGAESPGRCQTTETEEVVNGVGVLEDLGIRSLTETSDLVGGTGAADVVDHVVEEGLLPFWAVDGQWAARDSDCCAEQTFVVALVGYEVSSYGPRAGGLSHDGDFCRVATESLDVLLNPLHCDALVFKAKVKQTGLLKFL